MCGLLARLTYWFSNRNVGRIHHSSLSYAVSVEYTTGAYCLQTEVSVEYTTWAYIVCRLKCRENTPQEPILYADWSVIHHRSLLSAVSVTEVSLEYVSIISTWHFIFMSVQRWVLKHFVGQDVDCYSDTLHYVTQPSIKAEWKVKKCHYKSWTYRDPAPDWTVCAGFESTVEKLEYIIYAGILLNNECNNFTYHAGTIIAIAPNRTNENKLSMITSIPLICIIFS